MVGTILCFLGFHERLRIPLEEPGRDCLRCGEDARESWEIELENMDRLEALYLRAMKKK